MEVFPANIPCGVQIGVDLKSTGTANKSSLADAVATFDVATAAAALAGVAGVDDSYADAELLALMLRTDTELVVRPPMVPAALLGSTLFGAVTKSGEIFHNHRGGADRDSVGDQLLGQDSIAIQPKPVLAATDLLEVPFGRFCAFGLECAFKLETPRFDFFPSAFAEEESVGGHDGSVDAEIGTKDLFADNVGGCHGNNQFEPKTARALDEIGAVDAGGATQPPICLRMVLELDAPAATYRSQAH